MLANPRATKLTTKMAAAEWTCAEEDRLVTLWQEKPCLFNTGLNEFSNRNIKRQALTELAEALNRPGNVLIREKKRENHNICVCLAYRVYCYLLTLCVLYFFCSHAFLCMMCLARPSHVLG